MTDAVSYSTKVQEKFIEQPEFLFWRGRILIYNGQTEVGKKHIKQALNVDPDSKKLQQYWKNLQKSERVKNEAAEAFKAGDIETAIKLYDECFVFDPLNNAFNVTILYNKACAFAKVAKNDEALHVLGQAITMNKEYVKVYLKRGDIYMQMEKF
jgi:tetratricopeptide (TPR) repeat protein